jgi:predicted Ser/Thr protein kinase
VALDDYDVIRELGRGGMAIVHLARQRDLGRLAALKELAGFNAGDPAFAERFLRESRVAGSLNHQNIVTVYEYFDDGGVPFIAMELIEGGSLRPLIGELSLPKVARVLEDLLAAVGYAGRNGIVHRDLKPENALITKDGRVKVADFGIAKAAASGQQGLTSEGMTVGTPEYMSPEQAMARDVEPTSDLYSIGCMTYEMLTGRLPFNEASQVALLMRHVNDEVPDVREVDPLIPESVALWVAKMTAKDRDDRYADADEAWEAFEEAILEFVGPLWRRDATLEPGSAIDVDDLPPQGPAPLRPPSRTGAGAGAGAAGGATGFQTYHAPAALYEQLAAEGVDAGAAAVVTPPPTAAPVRRARPTPAPVSAAVPVVAAPAPATTAAPAPADEPAPRGLPVGAIVAAGAVVLIALFVVGISGGKSASVASAAGDGFVLEAPSGWIKTTAPATPALGASAAALAPPGAGGGAAISAARLPDGAAAALVRGAGGPARVRLSAGEAARYGAGLFVLPTSDGTVVVSCSAGADVQSVCGSVASSLKLTRGTPRALGPTEEGAQALTGALNRLRTNVANPTDDLAAARAAGAEALAAGDLARVYRGSAKELAVVAVGALAQPARDEMSAAVKELGDAWARFARAARANDAGGVATARRAVSRARARLNRSRGALAAAGYPGGSAG